jgi:formylglycine-generating enzyme required for sulfatase activity
LWGEVSYLHIAAMKKVLPFVTLIALNLTVSAAVSIDWVTIGNAGNAADPLTGYGSVGSEYRIGKYEVTNAQYAEFLNAKAATDSYLLYNPNMDSYGITRSGSSGSYTYSVTGALASRPVVYVSWFDAARFANWLANGQGSGSTETGSYTLNGATSGIITANPGATIYLPSEDEWYKAAYYNSATSTYSLYPNGLNAITVADANFDGTSSSDVGTFSSDPSSFGTFDQGGNVWEWNDAFGGASYRGIRGGSWGNDALAMRSFNGGAYDLSYPASEETASIGFRLSSIPEPSSLVFLVSGFALWVVRRR